jgi:hypothetical protein
MFRSVSAADHLQTLRASQTTSVEMTGTIQATGGNVSPQIFCIVQRGPTLLLWVQKTTSMIIKINHETTIVPHLGRLTTPQCCRSPATTEVTIAAEEPSPVLAISGALCRVGVDPGGEFTVAGEKAGSPEREEEDRGSPESAIWTK